MKVVFHNDFKSTDYCSNGAFAVGRMETIVAPLEQQAHYEMITPSPASYDDISLAHSSAHIAAINKNGKLFQAALLAVGGAIRASELAMEGEPAFACIRPPGHHASRNSAWGYCAFCNVGIALLKMKNAGQIQSVFLLDFDAHTGDGNKDVLSDWKDANILNPTASDNKQYLKQIEEYISAISYVDMIAVSAGFDTYEKDMGKKLTTSDFYFIGNMLKRFSKKMGHSRRFAVLEGGYYLPDLGKNALAVGEGFK